jgi:hypothetical protein
MKSDVRTLANFHQLKPPTMPRRALFTYTTYLPATPNQIPQRHDIVAPNFQYRPKQKHAVLSPQVHATPAVMDDATLDAPHERRLPPVHSGKKNLRDDRALEVKGSARPQANLCLRRQFRL